MIRVDKKDGFYMKQDLHIIDNFIDEREFRNYVGSILKERGFIDIVIDDVTLNDENQLNDNDIKATLDGVPYTIQTFLNKEITKLEIDEVVADMNQEIIGQGILVTNTVIKEEIKEYASNYRIELWDRDILAQYLLN